MKRYYCTYFDRNYLIKGLSLIESLKAHERSDFTLFAVCLDEITRLLVEQLAPPNVVPIALHAIERGDDSLAAARADRTLVEYYWTLTPTVIAWLLERHPEIESLLYLDADLYFFDAPDSVWDEMDRTSVLIQPHRFSPELSHLERYGLTTWGWSVFVETMMAPRCSIGGVGVCLEWCHCRLEEGRYGDQLYLNRFPEISKRVHPLAHIGGGVAPWNHMQYALTLGREGRPLVDGQPVIFYHFHSLAVFEPQIIVPTKYLTNRVTEPLLRHVFVPYAEALTAAFSGPGA